MQFGQCRAQLYAFGIAVFPHLGLRHSRDGAGRGAKDVFIGAEPRFEGAAKDALLRFGAHEGDIGGQAFGEGGEACICHAPRCRGGPVRGQVPQHLPPRFAGAAR